MVKRVKKGHEQDDHEFDNVYNCDADERYDGVDSSIWYNWKIIGWQNHPIFLALEEGWRLKVKIENWKLSIVHCELSIVNWSLSIVNCALSIINYYHFSLQNHILLFLQNRIRKMAIWIKTAQKHLFSR